MMRSQPNHFEIGVASVSFEACLSLKFKSVWTMILFLDPTFSYKHFCAI